MDQQEALQVISSAVEKATGKTAEITLETDLIEDEILDSLDGMVFAMEIETATGKTFPEDEDLVKAGYYRVEKLVEFMTA